MRRRPLVLTGLVTVATLLATTALATSSSAQAPARGARHAARSTLPTKGWLTLVNYYRVGSGLSRVTANPTWVAGLEDHLRYLAKTPQKYFVGKYQSLHTENPASPYYTSIGAKEGGSSDLYEGYVGATPDQLIDGWLSAPFHAIGMLRPNLKQVAFASTPKTGDAGLDVISGLTEISRITLKSGKEKPPSQVLFPGNGTVTDLSTDLSGESPNPLKTCHWSGVSGVPLFALLTSVPSRSLSATLKGPHGTESTAADTLCVVDSNDYVSPTTIYGPTGAEILSSTDAVLLIPRAPLPAGRFVASIFQAGKPAISWTFSEGALRAAPVSRNASSAESPG